MFFGLKARVSLAILVISTVFPALSQVVPSAREGGLPLSVGVGISDFDLDWTTNHIEGRRMEGATVWADWSFYHAPSLLRGIGVEAEVRDINFGRPSSLTRMRQITGQGGVIYTFRRYSNVHPYAKYLMGLGSIDFLSTHPSYKHDTRTIHSPGAGLEYRVYRNIWVRGDWEYQYWPSLFRYHTLNPNGFTIGASYDFRHHQGNR
jgi:opacity protein-like surface antigen